ncbi:hypothetical protein [Methanobacterium sp. ACI-7]|uniref:hypothetical protein n=1 Tax=unclassified Methanobacterium TaxID=2627676 RepID=UPI0039C37A0A
MSGIMSSNNITAPLMVILCGFLVVINLFNQKIPESSLQYALFFISGFLVGLILVLVFKIFSNIK